MFVREPEDENEDDQESVVDFPVDETFNCLVNYIYDQYLDSRPHSDPSVPPRCEFESFFAVRGCGGNHGYKRSRRRLGSARSSWLASLSLFRRSSLCVGAPVSGCG